MPWGCVGGAVLGSSGPGFPNCGTSGFVLDTLQVPSNPNSFNSQFRKADANGETVVDPASGAYNSIPRKPETV